MKTRSIFNATAILLLGSAASLNAQERMETRSPPTEAPSAAAGRAEVVRLYDSLSARPGWPARASEAEVDSGLARQGLDPEQRRTIIGLLKQDVCQLPQMVPVCRYYGPETIYKVQKLAWEGFPATGPARGRPAERRPAGDLNILQMQLMDYGANRNLARLYGERGLTDAQEAQLNNSGSRQGDAARAAGVSTQLSVWFNCGTDQRNLPATTWMPITQEYRLTTCGAGFGFYMRIVIFKWSWSFEVDVLATHSRFARRVLGVWWATGSEPNICSNSIIQWSGNLQCNAHSWTSPVSFRSDSFTNSPPASVISTGSAVRLGTHFGVTVVHQ